MPYQCSFLDLYTTLIITKATAACSVQLFKPSPSCQGGNCFICFFFLKNILCNESRLKLSHQKLIGAGNPILKSFSQLSFMPSWTKSVEKLSLFSEKNINYHKFLPFPYIRLLGEHKTASCSGIASFRWKRKGRKRTTGASMKRTSF